MVRTCAEFTPNKHVQISPNELGDRAKLWKNLKLTYSYTGCQKDNWMVSLMNRTTMYILVGVLVIVVVVAGVGIYLFMGTGGGGGGGGGGTQNTYTVANATSLQLEADVTSQGATVTYKWAGKNLNTSQLMLRVDLLGGAAGNYSYILNASNQTAWSAENGAWTDVSSTFNSLWSSWGTQWTGYLSALANWSGTGGYSYTASNGDSVTISNIAINPTLSDSLFQPS